MERYIDDTILNVIVVIVLVAITKSSFGRGPELMEELLDKSIYFDESSIDCTRCLFIIPAPGLLSASALSAKKVRIGVIEIGIIIAALGADCIGERNELRE